MLSNLRLLLLPLWMLSSCCFLPKTAQAQIKLSEVKTQTWVGFENPQVVNGVIVAGTNSKPTLAAVTSLIAVSKVADYKFFEIEAENLETRQFAELEEVKDGYKFKVGTPPGRYRVTARGFDPGLVTVRVEVICEPPKPIDPEPIVPKPENDIQRIVENAMIEMRRGYASSFKRTADEIAAGRLETDDKLQKFMFPITKAAREQAVAGIDGLLQDKMPRDGSKVKPEAAGFLREIAVAFERGTK